MSTYGYLAHHGVKGQKWGIRRYQNPDGSLTPEGMRRYGIYSNQKNIANKLDSMTNELSKNRKLLKDKAFMDEYKKVGDDWEKELKQYKNKDYRESIKVGKRIDKALNKISSQKPKSTGTGKKVAAGVLSVVGPLTVATVIGGGYLLTRDKGPSMEELSKRIEKSLK